MSIIHHLSKYENVYLIDILKHRLQAFTELGNCIGDGDVASIINKWKGGQTIDVVNIVIL